MLDTNGSNKAKQLEQITVISIIVSASVSGSVKLNAVEITDYNSDDVPSKYCDFTAVNSTFSRDLTISHLGLSHLTL